MQSDRASAAKPAPGRARWVVVALIVAVVFLGVEALEAVLAAEALPATVRFAALHSVGAVTFGILSVLSVIAAIVLSPRLWVVLIGACLAAAAAALLFV
jgi:hypothetical protein